MPDCRPHGAPRASSAAEYWGSLFNVEVTWFDGELAAPKQRAAIDNMASQKWDFVAIQAFGIGTLTDPVNKMIDAGIPVIDLDTLIAPLDTINVQSFLAPDNEFMGSAVTQALVTAIGGKGNIVMTQGALGHTGAQGRARGFNSVVKNFPNVKVLDTTPADWDVTKVARIWETLLTKYPQIDAAFFHNDDMALAAYNVMKGQPHQHPDRRRRCHAAGPGCGARRPDACHGPQSLLPHPWRRHLWRRRCRGERRKDRPGRHSQACHHRRARRHQGQRSGHGVDGGALPHLRMPATQALQIVLEPRTRRRLQDVRRGRGAAQGGLFARRARSTA
jgi:hypothetical protein